MIWTDAAPIVHTTGVNWDGVLAIVSPMTVILGIFGGVVIRSIKRSIKDEVTDVVAKQVTPVLNEIKDEIRLHDTRIARLEGIDVGRQAAVAAAGVTTRPD